MTEHGTYLLSKSYKLRRYTRQQSCITRKSHYFYRIPVVYFINLLIQRSYTRYRQINRLVTQQKYN